MDLAFLGYPVRGFLGPVQACDVPISGVVKVVSGEIVGETDDNQVNAELGGKRAKEGRSTGARMFAFGAPRRDIVMVEPVSLSTLRSSSGPSSRNVFTSCCSAFPVASRRSQDAVTALFTQAQVYLGTSSHSDVAQTVAFCTRRQHRTYG